MGQCLDLMKDEPLHFPEEYDAKFMTQQKSRMSYEIPVIRKEYPIEETDQSIQENGFSRIDDKQILQDSKKYFSNPTLEN